LSSHGVALSDGAEFLSEVTESTRVKFILVRLQVAKLSELLAAIVEFAGERLDLLVHDLVRSDVSTLRKRFTTNVALVRPLTSVTSLMRLEIS